MCYVSTRPIPNNIQDGMSDVDWDMFRSSSSDVSEIMDVVTSFIAMLEDTIILTVNPTARTAAYISGLVSDNMDKYKMASYGLRRAVKDTKRRYRDRMEAQMEQHMPMMRATDYHRLPGQNPLNCECLPIPSG